jgi:DNA-binding NtrC family response regulator
VKKANRKKRVLVVEDEPVISQICKKTLLADGFEVDTAFNGLIAKEILSRQEYDFCIMDIRTPQMNGIELYQHLEDEYPELVRGVIVTTGDVLSPNVASFLEKVSCPFLPKPFTPDELRVTIKEAMRIKGPD